MDPVKFMMGKYEESDITIPTFGIVNDTKIYQSNNSAYVDRLFNFLTSQLLHQYHFIHGIEYYGSFIGLKHGFKVNVEDELSMIYQSDFYQEHKDSKIKLLGNIEDYLYNESDSRNFKEKLSIHSNTSLKSSLSFESIDQELNDLFVATPNNNVDNTIPLTEHNLSTHNNENVEMASNRSSSASIVPVNVLREVPLPTENLSQTAVMTKVKNLVIVSLKIVYLVLVLLKHYTRKLMFFPSI